MNALVNFTQTSTIVPANPYVKGAEALGQFFTSSLAPIFGNKNDVDDPNFSLSFSTSQVSTGCDTQDLQEGIGVEIADYNKGDESSGFIQTANRNNYCFYKMYDDRDPDIGFIQKPAGGCTQAVPAALTTLNNPQFIWAASSKGMGRNSTDHRLQVCKSVGISANRCLSKSVGEPLQNRLRSTDGGLTDLRHDPFAKSNPVILSQVLKETSFSAISSTPCPAHC